ncbi:MAG: membrane dipeptidase [Alphaproteobacteria bacterium]|nr:membrane dipeptidase [Alphaproteobacteria bacterium]
MPASALHRDAIIVDGLIIANFGHAVFADMKRGGLTAANCTCSVWEGFRASMDNIVRWQGWFRDHGDLIMPVRTSADILRAKKIGKVGIILGWQNLSGIEDQLGYLQIFKELGVGVMQMTYNTRNLVGSGCYESIDPGLSDFGREVVAEINRVGILCDLSHVGAKTSEDVIKASKKPVAYTHCLPAALKAHPRNKTDDQLRFIARRDGFVGVTMFAPFLKRGNKATVVDYVEAIEHVLNLCGEDQVGIGTDFTQGYGKEFYEWLNHDKGYARRIIEFGKVVNAKGMRTIGEFPNLTQTMEKRRWPERRIRKVMGENWVRLLKDVWGA